MDLTDKIKQILVDKNLTPSIFADEIGIQRSSMSHILAGRNKPSLDMVQKIVKRYPELGLNWIMDDEELPVVQNEPPRESRKRPASEPASVQVADAAPKMAVKPEKKMEKVLVFYSDGTFQEFRHT